MADNRPLAISEDAKFCPGCSRVRPRTRFTLNRSRSDGLQSICAECKRPDNAARYAANPGRPDKVRQEKQRRRALKKGATVEPFSAADWAAYVEHWDMYSCVYCGGPAEHLDHVVPLSRGGEHSLQNLVWSCAADNLSKGPSTGCEYVGRRRTEDTDCA